MDLEDEQGESLALPLPVVPRLDRLDHLLKLLEDNHKLLKKQECNAKGDQNADDARHDDRIKPMSTALEEVHFKGTLMDRIALLEQRVLQLSLQMDMDNTSGSSSSIRQPLVVPDTMLATSDHGLSKESFRMQQELEPPQVIQDAKRPEQTSMVTMQGCGYRRWRRKTTTKSRKKMFEWLQI